MINKTGQSYHSVLMMIKNPALKCKKAGKGWYISFHEPGIDLGMYGNTKEAALDAFWDYVYGLIPDLEAEEKLSKKLQCERDFLRQYFLYKKNGRSKPCRPAAEN